MSENTIDVTKISKAVVALGQVQQKLDVPKSKRNNYGGYYYRTVEQINEKLKPIMREIGATHWLSDSIVTHGEKLVLESTAYFFCQGEIMSATASAMLADSKKGMDEAQIQRPKPK